MCSRRPHPSCPNANRQRRTASHEQTREPAFSAPGAPCPYMPCMPTYTVLPRQRQPGYKGALVGDAGPRQTILGFNSESEAETWVAEDKRLEVFRHVLAAD